MTTSSYKVGDLVQLKSGGPVMTIYHVDRDNAHCKWFAGAKLEEGHFGLAMLQNPEPKKPATKKAES